jgi:hypothetical protein
MAKIVEPGDVEIKRFEISNKTLKASMSPLDQLLGADIFEDITKPTLYAEFYFQDSLNLLKNFPIIGEEDISIEIKTPGIAKTTLYKFRTFDIANIAKDKNGKGLTYVIRCVSDEHLRAGSSLVKESQTNTVDKMVPYILSKYCDSKKAIIIDDTKGIQTIPFPKQNPLMAIDMLRQRAVSKEYAASAYVFFENQDGFNFMTIEGLIKQGKKDIGSRIFNVIQNPNASKEAVANSFRTVKKYETIAKADGNKKASQGIYQAVTKTFDINTKGFESRDFNLKEVFNKLQKPASGKVQIPNSDEFIKEYGQGVPKQFFTLKDTLRPDNFMDTAMAVRNSYSVLLNSEVVRFLVHGDSGLKVGDLITVNFSDPVGTTDRKKDDPMLSGNYLITKLRHMITPSTKNKHEISMDCVKMGV